MSGGTVWGIVGVTLLVAAALLALIRRPTKRWLRLLVWLACLTALTVPTVRGVSLAGYLYGYLGDLSVPTVALLLLYVGRRGEPSTPWRRTLLLLVLLGGLVLYPFSLGPFPFDPYGWGYRPGWFLAAVAAAGLLALRRHPAVTAVIAAAIGAYVCRLSASTNLWDYLLDPLLVLVAIWVIIVRPLFAGKRGHRVRPATGK